MDSWHHRSKGMVMLTSQVVVVLEVYPVVDVLRRPRVKSYGNVCLLGASVLSVIPGWYSDIDAAIERITMNASMYISADTVPVKVIRSNRYDLVQNVS